MPMIIARSCCVPCFGTINARLGEEAIQSNLADGALWCQNHDRVRRRDVTQAKLVAQVVVITAPLVLCLPMAGRASRRAETCLAAYSDCCKWDSIRVSISLSSAGSLYWMSPLLLV